MTTAEEEAKTEEPTTDDQSSSQLHGSELFAELKKLLPSCIEEDYRVGLAWKDEVMRLDCELVRRHREDAGAPDVETRLPPVYIPPAPEVWTQPIKPALQAGGWAAGLIAAKAAAFQAMQQQQQNLPVAKPAGQVNATPPGSTVGPKAAGVFQQLPETEIPVIPLPTTAKAAGPSTAVSTTSTAAASTSKPANAPSAASDLKQMKAFVAQWQLELTKTKLLFAKVTPAKRRWVMEHFRFVPASGKTSQATLEEYMQICEKNNLWKDAELATASWNQDKASQGVKRPVEAGEADPAAKRPALQTPLQPGIMNGTGDVPHLD